MTPTPVLPSLPEPALRAALRLFIGAAYPVDISIDPRGHRWSEAYLDQALTAALGAIESLSRAPAEQADPNLVKEFRATGLTGAEAVAAARGLAGLQDTHPTESAGPVPAGMLLVSEAALRQIARAIEGLKRECGMDPESPQAIRNAQYMSLAYAVRKLGESHDASA